MVANVKTKSEENPVNGTEARRQLGAPGKPWGSARMAAIKKAMGLTGRYMFLSQVRAWLRDHPDFKERDIYPRKANQGRSCSRTDRPAATADRTGEL